ncbi:hypothetical protein GCM10011393_21050 [Sphingopyxis bauzanensis]|nr:hypothetical protein GCM10011393_21050 [Sphingopyxis bauzanensis]
MSSRCTEPPMSSVSDFDPVTTILSMICPDPASTTAAVSAMAVGLDNPAISNAQQLTLILVGIGPVILSIRIDVPTNDNHYHLQRADCAANER